MNSEIVPFFLGLLSLAAAATLTVCLMQILFGGRFTARHLLITMTIGYMTLVLMGMLSQY